MIWTAIMAIVAVLAVVRVTLQHRRDNAACDHALSSYRDLVDRLMDDMNTVAAHLRSATATAGIPHHRARELADLLDPPEAPP